MSYSDGNDFFDKTAYSDQRMETLIQKIHEQELEAIEAQKKQNNNKGGKFQWIRYFVYFWAFRLGLPVVNSIFSSFYNAVYSGKNMTEDLKIIHRIHLSEFEKNVSSILQENLPIVVKEYRGSSLKAKISNNSHFSYFDESRPWAAYYRHLKSYDLLPMQHLTGQIAATLVTASENRFQYAYVAIPDMQSYLESLAPPLINLVKITVGRSKSALVQSNLWLASHNTTAIMHYDLQDNFLLQLNGTKRVLIASPESFSLLKPFPAAHPLWRQASNASIYKSELLLKAAAQQGKFLLWETDLSPGDLLFIPAGFMHSVKAGQGSISINTWFPSKFSEVHAMLLKADLPFSPEEKLSIKIANLFSLMRRICGSLSQPSDCLLADLQSRFLVTFVDSKEWTCPLNNEICNYNIDENNGEKESEERIASYITNVILQSKIQRFQQIIILTDYIEEILGLIFADKFKPCMLELMFLQCR